MGGINGHILESITNLISSNKLTELFWLQLQLRRKNINPLANEIHKYEELKQEEMFRKIKKQVTNYASVIWGLIASLTIAIAGSLGVELSIRITLIFWEILFIGVGGLIYYQVDKNKRDPSEEFIEDYFLKPDYSMATGTIHNAIKDLQSIFDILDKTISKIIIIIDDLDRCSSDHVAEVFEAINLVFYSTNTSSNANQNSLNRIIFIVAVDAEKTALALNKKYNQDRWVQYNGSSTTNESLNHTMNNANQQTLGWNFMNKFVQIPFTIPKINNELITDYLNDITSTKQTIVSPVGSDPGSPGLSGVVSVSIQRTVDTTIPTKSQIEDNPTLRDSIADVGLKFSLSPRQMKRFVNLVRLYYYIKTIKKWEISDYPLVLWAALNIEFPSFVNWYNKERSKVKYQDASLPVVLTDLIKKAKKSTKLISWIETLRDNYYIHEDSDPWIVDDNLYQFFRRESMSTKKIDRRSGEGLW